MVVGDVMDQRHIVFMRISDLFVGIIYGLHRIVLTSARLLKCLYTVYYLVAQVTQKSLLFTALGIIEAVYVVEHILDRFGRGGKIGRLLCNCFDVLLELGVRVAK